MRDSSSSVSPFHQLRREKPRPHDWPPNVDDAEMTIKHQAQAAALLLPSNPVTGMVLAI
jgi:aspartate/methionine/tyrosine aminotransferase